MTPALPWLMVLVARAELAELAAVAVVVVVAAAAASAMPLLAVMTAATMSPPASGPSPWRSRFLANDSKDHPARPPCLAHRRIVPCPQVSCRQLPPPSRHPMMTMMMRCNDVPSHQAQMAAEWARTALPANGRQTHKTAKRTSHAADSRRRGRPQAAAAPWGALVAAVGSTLAAAASCRGDLYTQQAPARHP